MGYETNPTEFFRSLLINFIRIVLVISIYLALTEHKRVLILVSILALLLTFLPLIIKPLYKKNSFLLYDLTIILSSFGLFYFWEVKGTYSNFIVFSTLMNLFEAIIIGFLGFTIINSIFKSQELEGNHFFIAFFSFCLSFSVGAILEIIEVSLNLLIKFKPYQIGVLDIIGDLIFYFIGALIVSIAGYISFKKNRPILISDYIDEFTNNDRLLNFFKLQKKDNLEENILKIIKKGEGDNIEFKSTLRKNLHTNQFDKNIEHSILKTINAYLNTDGGILLIGVNDKGEIIGLDNDNFSTMDHAHRHLVQLVRDHIGPEFTSLIKTKTVNIEGKYLLKVECKKSKKETFLKDNKEEYFYIRHGSMSTPLNGTSLIKYIENTFRKK